MSHGVVACRLPKSSGHRFVWSETHKMHVSIETAQNCKEQEERTTLRRQAEAVFSQAGRTSLRWSDFLTNLMQTAQLKEGGARKRMDKMLGTFVVKKDALGNYELSD